MDAKHQPFFFRTRFRSRILRFFVLALLGFTAALPALPLSAFAVDYGDHKEGDSITQEEAQRASDIQPEVYERLGLEISPVIPDDTVAPVSEDHAVDLITRREVYVSANGASANKYAVRNHLNVLGPTSSRKGEKNWSYTDYGSHWGAYKFWDINDNTSRLLENSGGTIDSYLSSNKGSAVMSKDTAHFDGKYATSVACSVKKGMEACDDHVAELRAYNGASSQRVNSSDDWHAGLIKIALFSFDENGKRQDDFISLTPTLHPSQYLVTDGYNELNYLDFGYLQEYDAYFELEAADVNGDGIDELFAYTGAYEDVNGNRYAIVYMYRSTNGTNWSCSSVKVNTGAASNYTTIDELKKQYSHWRWRIARLAPVVTLAACDLDRDGTEEIAITTSAPIGHKDATAAAWGHVFHWDDAAGNVVSVEGLDNIQLSANGKAMTSANCAAGNFLLPESYYSFKVSTLIFAGWETHDKTTSTTAAWDKFAYCYAYYNPTTHKYEVSDYTEHDLGKDATVIANSAARKTGGDKRYMPTMAPFALECAHLDSAAFGTTGDCVLAGGEIYRFQLSSSDGSTTRPGFGIPIGSMSLFSSHSHQGFGYEDIKAKDHIWIGDVVSGYVANDDAAHDSFLAVIGVRRDDNLRDSDDYYWFDVAHYTFDKGNTAHACTGQEGVIKESTRMGKKSGPNLSLCLPDLGKDSVRMRLVDKAVFPTAPQVLAVLQDTPYFSELEDAYHYLNASATSFGKGSSQSVGKGFAINVAAGGHLKMAWGEGPTFEFDAALQGALSYDMQWSTATDRSISYTATGGKGNKVVAYAVPMYYYYYEVFNPETQTWDPYYQTMAGDPVSTVVSVEVWDEVASDTKTLPLIGADPSNLGDSLSNVSGAPETYLGTSMAGNKYLDSNQITTVSTNTGEGSSVTQPITIDKSVASDLFLGLQVNVTTGFGFGLLGSKAEVGPVVDFSAGYAKSKVKTDETFFSGTVDNLPDLKGVVNGADRYSFQWTLQVNRLEHSESDKKKYKDENKRPLDDVFLVGYLVDKVTRPAIGVVSDPRVDKVTSDSITLSWMPVDFGKTNEDKDCVYSVGLLAAGSSDDVAKWFTIDAEGAHPSSFSRIEYVVKDAVVIKPEHDYRFIVVAQAGKKEGSSFTPEASSLRTPILEARTLEVGESIRIVGQPKQLGVLQEGADASYSVSAQWDKLDKNVSDGIAYTWQRWDFPSSSWIMLGYGEGNSDISVNPPTKPDVTPLDQGAKEGALSSASASHAGQTLLSLGDEDAAFTKSTLTMKSVVPSQDGMIIRCDVGFGQQVIASSVVVLNIEKKDDKPTTTRFQRTAVTQTSSDNPLWFMAAQGSEGNGRIGEVQPDDKPDDNKPDDNKQSDGGGKNGGTVTPASNTRVTPKTADGAAPFAQAFAVVALVSAVLACVSRRMAGPRRSG